MRRFVAIVTTALLSVQCGDRLSVRSDRSHVPRAKAKPVHASVCEILSNAARFNNQRVQIDGCVITDGLERVAITDRELVCAAGSIVPTESGILKPESKLRPDVHTKLCGTFIGTFRSSTPVYNNVLEVEETRELERLALQERQ